ncbi:VanZ family protein [Streptomonospora salina]|uniref:VanZ family protein n=1 Tax=Streptomonospora salina TaxID=104205 RepID=A0A841E5E3_9ACTN|nr:VanZ family protein [Streptomonospora salina]MBB5998365.1 VanZ family protein [Streptomonospora salina]
MGTSTLRPVAELVVVLLPAVVLIVAALAMWRIRQGRPAAGAVAASAADVLAVFALLPVYSATLATPGTHGGLVLVPFSDMFATGLSATALYQSGGNIALFMPLGALLPLAFGRRLARWYRVAGAAAALSATVETLQHTVAAGHVASIDDVLLNTAGALAGAALTRPWWRRERQRASAGAAGKRTPAR